MPRAERIKQSLDTSWISAKVRKIVEAVECPKCGQKRSRACENLNFMSAQFFPLQTDSLKRKRRRWYQNYVHPARRKAYESERQSKNQHKKVLRIQREIKADREEARPASPA